MALIVVKKTLTSASCYKIRINEKLKAISFGSKFIQMEHLDQANYVRFAYDDEKNIIAFEFLKEETVSTECFKLNKVVTLSSLLNYCNINIKDIAGVYSKNAIEGPVDIPGFSKNAYLIYINKREIPVKKSVK